MKISSKAGLVGLLMALSTITAQAATAAANPSEQQAELDSQKVQSRLARLSAILRQREGQLPVPMAAEVEQLQAIWVNGGGGGFLNRRWPNGWRDGGGFLNNRGGGGFLNRR